MGSGCTSNSNNSRCLSPISSNCITYVGDPYTSLGICTNDIGTEVFEALADAISGLTSGVTITPTSINQTCALISAQLAGITNPTLNQFIQAIIVGLCQVNTGLTDLSEIVNEPVTYNNPGCLTMPTTITTPNVLQAVINQLCSLTTTVTTLIDVVDDGPTLTTTLITQIKGIISNYFTSNITTCSGNGITRSTDSEGNSVLQFDAMVPAMCPIPYIGNPGNFDATGKGIASRGYCGWYMLVGNYGLPDWRGYAFAGATNIPGISAPALDQRVDPVYNSDPSYASNMGDKKGEVKHILVNIEGAPHTHTINDPGHIHNFASQLATRSGGSSIIWVVDVNTSGCQGGATDSSFGGFGPCSHTFSGKVLSNTTGITVNSSPNAEPHENRQPTVYGAWIMRIA